MTYVYLILQCNKCSVSQQHRLGMIHCAVNKCITWRTQNNGSLNICKFWRVHFELLVFLIARPKWKGAFTLWFDFWRYFVTFSKLNFMSYSLPSGFTLKLWFWGGILYFHHCQVFTFLRPVSNMNCSPVWIDFFGIFRPILEFIIGSHKFKINTGQFSLLFWLRKYLKHQWTGLGWNSLTKP